MRIRDRWKYSRLRPKNTATHTRYRNWLSRRYWTRVNSGGPDKRPLPDRIGRAVTSRTPVVRNRINPATGRPRWTDRSPQHMARWRVAREQGHAPTRVDRDAARVDRRHGGTAVTAGELSDRTRNAQQAQEARTARTRAKLDRGQAQATRAAANRRHVRETLTARDPEYARMVDRAAREASPRPQRRSR